MSEVPASRITHLIVCLLLVSVAGVGTIHAMLAAPVPPPAWKNFTERLKPVQPFEPSGVVWDDVKFEMVYVPGGDFVMGSPVDERGQRTGFESAASGWASARSPGTSSTCSFRMAPISIVTTAGRRGLARTR
jgi:hypothetical protein